MDQPENLDAGVFKKTLETLLEKTANMLEREWPPRYISVTNGNIVFFIRMRIAINTYNAILLMTADIPKDPLRKPLLYAVAPLVRTLFEELVTLLFVLHDVPNLMMSFTMTSYTELWIERDEAQKYYSSNPKWKDYIDDLDKDLTKLANDLKLTKNQATDPKKYIKRWPTPGKAIEILRKRYPSSKLIPFMEFIHTWMYRSLSGESHLDFRAVQRRGVPLTKDFAKYLHGENYKEILHDQFIKYHKEMMWTTYTVLLAIISEIEAHFSYKMKDDLKYLWIIFANHSDMAKDFYDQRYKQLLN